MIKLPRLNIEITFITLAFAIGLILRFLYLGSAPLSDFEAERALGALSLSKGLSMAAMPNPGYMLLTGFLFNLFEGSNFIARFWVAIAGSLIILVPYLFRSLLGRSAAVVLAFGFALDPGLVAISRLAGGPMLSLGFGLLAMGLLYQRKSIWSGIFGGLALLGGSTIWHGVLIFLIAWFMGKLVFKQRFNEIFAAPGEYPEKTHALRNGLLAGGSVILMAGTLVFWAPQGLSNFASTVPVYLGGWLAWSGVSVTQLLTALFIYQPLAIIFGISGAVRSWMESKPFPRWLSLWAVTSLVIVLAYPGGQVYDLVWVLIPLWAMAAMEFSRSLSIDKRDRLAALGQAFLIFLLMALAWLNLAGLDQNPGDQAIRLRWAVILGTLALGVVTTILVGLGWSASAAKHGLVWGLIAGLGIYGLANTWWVSQLRANGENGLWYPPPAIRQKVELITTLEGLSEINTGIPNEIDIVVTNPAPSLRWALRNFPNSQFTTGAVARELPSVIISGSEEAAPELAGSYRGQDFAWQVKPGWQGGFPKDWLAWPRWLVFRDAPQEVAHIILWARSDLFPGGELLLTDEESPAEPETPLKESPPQ